MGDVVCTLPLIAAAKKKHPNKLIIFVTASGYKNLVTLAKSADGVYGSSLWSWDFRLPDSFNFMGIVEKVYNPLATSEVSDGIGGTCHFIDDAAKSCGLSVSVRQPKLHPSIKLIRNTKIKFGVEDKDIGNKKIIAINGGPTWPIRMWDVKKWQSLIYHIHDEFDAVILLLGQTQHGIVTDLQKLKGVKNLFNILRPEEIVALISICDLVVAIDSGPVHLAGTVGTSVIGLFGPINPKFRLPPESPSVGVVSNVPCLYCHHRTPIIHWKNNCPNDIICMKQLEEHKVFTILKEVLLKRYKISNMIIQ